MQIEINKNKYELDFGFSFIRQINRLMGLEIDVEGQRMNTQTGGLDFLKASLASLDPVGLVNAIEAGTITSKPRPTRFEIEAYISDLLKTDPAAYVALYEELEKAITEDAMLEGLAKVADILAKRGK